MSLRVHTDFHIRGIGHLAEDFGPAGFDKVFDPVGAFG